MVVCARMGGRGCCPHLLAAGPAGREADAGSSQQSILHACSWLAVLVICEGLPSPHASANRSGQSPVLTRRHVAAAAHRRSATAPLPCRVKLPGPSHHQHFRALQLLSSFKRAASWFAAGARCAAELVNQSAALRTQILLPS